MSSSRTARDTARLSTNAIELDLRERNSLPQHLEATTSKNDAPPENAVVAKETWKNPRINVWRVFATFYSLFVAGANDAVYGVSSTHLVWKDTANI